MDVLLRSGPGHRYDAMVFAMKWHAHQYQLDAVQALISHGAMGLLQDPGLGKTAQMLTAFKTLKDVGMAKQMLVISPLRPAHLVWPEQVLHWDHTARLTIAVLHGPHKEALIDHGKADIYVINPEGLKWLFSKWYKFHPDVLCIDESTRFKHADTLRFKLLKPFLNSFNRRYILTGSPNPNGLLDLFGQIYILDQGAALGRFISHYRMQYFDPEGYNNYQWKPKAGAEDAIKRAIAPITMCMRAKDYLQLPPLIGACGGETPPLITYVDLPPEARRTYDRMEGVLVAEVNKEVVSAVNAVSAAGKCRQIANGGMYGLLDLEENTKTRHHIHDAKTEAAQELVEEMSGVPCLIAYEFDLDRERLQCVFPEAPFIGGGVSPKEFKRIEAAWNEGSIPVLLAQPQSVAHGLNLQATRANVIWYGLTWDLENYEQLIRRVWRQGQEHPVFVHHIIARNTIDEHILKRLVQKDKAQQSFLNSLKESFHV